jgi:hypothetical protein
MVNHALRPSATSPRIVGQVCIRPVSPQKNAVSSEKMIRISFKKRRMIFKKLLIILENLPHDF